MPVKPAPCPERIPNLLIPYMPIIPRPHLHTPSCSQLPILTSILYFFPTFRSKLVLELYDALLEISELFIAPRKSYCVFSRLLVRLVSQQF